MGTLTREEIENEVKGNLDNRSDVDDLVTRWVNSAYMHMTHPAVHEFEDLRVTFDMTLISGQAEYDLEALVGFRILAIRNISYIPEAVGNISVTSRRKGLSPKPIEWYDRTIHPLTPEPQHYTAGEGQKILISHTPSNTNTLRMRLFRQAAKLTASSSTTIVPDYFDQALVWGAQGFAEFSLGDRARANETLQMYNSMLSNAAEKDLLESNNWGIETTLVSQPVMGISS